MHTCLNAFALGPCGVLRFPLYPRASTYTSSLPRSYIGTMFTSDSQHPDSPALDGRLKKLRSACDACHAAKVRCSGEATCSRCLRE